MITDSIFFIEYRFANEQPETWYRMECMGPFFDPLTAADICGRFSNGIIDTDYRVVQYRRVDA